MASLYKFMVTNLNWALNPVWKPYISLGKLPLLVFTITLSNLCSPSIPNPHRSPHVLPHRENRPERNHLFFFLLSYYSGNVLLSWDNYSHLCVESFFLYLQSLLIRSFLISIKYQLTPTSKKRPSERNQSVSNYMTS